MACNDRLHSTAGESSWHAMTGFTPLQERAHGMQRQASLHCRRELMACNDMREACRRRAHTTSPQPTCIPCLNQPSPPLPPPPPPPSPEHLLAALAHHLGVGCGEGAPDALVQGAQDAIQCSTNTGGKERGGGTKNSEPKHTSECSCACMC